MPAKLRSAVERRSIVALSYLNSLPRTVPFGLVMVLLLVGTFTTGIVAAVALGFVALFMGWLLYVGWPHMTGTARGLRLLVTVVVAAVAVKQFLG